MGVFLGNKLLRPKTIDLVAIKNRNTLLNRTISEEYEEYE